MKEELAGALAAEEAAIWAYGLIGVHLPDEAEQDQARACEDVHRLRRDFLVGRLAGLKASTAPTPPGYQLPFPVTDRASALKLAVHVEDGVAQAWRVVLPVTESAERVDALSALTDSAVRATKWRKLAQLSPLTLIFPGRPTA
ncbi:ferritin-like domain-containing protein [Actinoplanes oblitus]|uniref:Ferritin-like domain-containing protein n=1 Tax=Actinoplanes oblitus TaxID=3040509 RepID=A0ABY8WEB4_9ACTN|nr:ferritin-like domain-containing protein [Actinoplanes oblitus]WIM95403.1 ferritin-like domain-containing protein [Actinoplanes oblitus]